MLVKKFLKLFSFLDMKDPASEDIEVNLIYFTLAISFSVFPSTSPYKYFIGIKKIIRDCDMRFKFFNARFVYSRLLL